jgi:hypothetical protein
MALKPALLLEGVAFILVVGDIGADGKVQAKVRLTNPVLEF